MRALPGLLLALAVSCPAHSQNRSVPNLPPPAPPNVIADPGYTLRVYTNLIQIPTLVLNRAGQVYPGLARDQFTVRLDEGPPFHPTQIRQQSSDPIDLTILLDVSDSSFALPGGFAKAFASLPAGSLTARDRLQLYGVDCVLIRVADDTLSLATIQAGVDALLANPALHTHGRRHSGCDSSRPLWNDIATAALHMPQDGSRRVLLVVSDGLDYDSNLSWTGLMEYLNSRSIAVFGISSLHKPLSSIPLGVRTSSRQAYIAYEDPFEILCASTGGFVFHTNTRGLGKALMDMLAMLRGRYIMEFPRPANASSGHHVLDVTLADRRATVRPSGIAVPLPDPSIAADPHTVSPGPRNAPLLGPRRPLPPPE